MKWNENMTKVWYKFAPSHFIVNMFTGMNESMVRVPRMMIRTCQNKVNETSNRGENGLRIYHEEDINAMPQHKTKGGRGRETLMAEIYRNEIDRFTALHHQLVSSRRVFWMVSGHSSQHCHQNYCSY